MDKYVRGKVLGKGSFGVCSIVTRKSDGKNFVVKEIDVSRMPRAERETAELEAKASNQVDVAISMGVQSMKQAKNVMLKLKLVCRLRKKEANTQGNSITCACIMMQLLMALNHPNIVRCVECFTANSKLCIVMDYCSEVALKAKQQPMYVRWDERGAMNEFQLTTLTTCCKTILGSKQDALNP
eukprot:1157850-Pelagomonas_calceolata.AAC.14